jgi:hypothetical protein
VGNLFLGLVKFMGYLFEQALHCFLPVEHVSCLFIALDVVLDLFLKILVHSLIFKDTEQALVNLIVEHFVLIGKIQMLFPQIFPFDSGLIQLAFAGAH